LSKTVQDYEENGQIKDAEILKLNEAIRISEANKTDGDTVHKIRVTDLEQEVEDLNKRFETLKSSHEVELIGKDNEIKNLKEKNIKQAKEHDIALQQEREKFPKKISKKKDENIQLKQQHQQEIEKIKAEHQQEIEKIKAEHSKSFSNKNTSSKEENITSVKDVAAGSIDSNQNVSSNTNGSDPVGVDNNENADLSAVIDEDDCVASDDEEEFGEYGFPEDKSNNNQT
jgi:hypothetical protein